MTKKGYACILGAISLLIFLLEIVLMWMVVVAHKWAYVWRILSYPVAGVPVAIFAVIAACLLGVVVTACVWLVVRVTQRRMATELGRLLRDFLDTDTDNATTVNAKVFGHDNARLLRAIQQQLIRLQEEIARYSKKPDLVEGESKEAVVVAERQRIARELHDSVSQQLFAAMMLLSTMRAVVEAKPALADGGLLKQLDTIERVINAAQSEMRALLLHLRPTSLAGKPLRTGIIGLLKELQTKINITIKWDIADVHLATTTEDHLFRIVQELLSNTLRHAEAKQLEVYLNTVGSNVVLRMIDDGVGFDTTTADNAGSYGLNNIEERAHSLGGTVKIISFPGQGTSVEVRVPLTTKEEHHD
ncbi:sensor histidine kinase [Lacticaseibacillus thailandensis]|uniref:Sensor histidine kinase n=1 Tax=Lacticaseibacillus thailandensis DSM 22698 = JCM 13996 TaxID=1423810 RepID=A0A0R2CID8_9LACO|nr:sensor histidine kinase [Lacticaseibacillus thailandensis]KRM88281.1 two-component system, sensor histidine kinase [Lacticaseibacillus thailandensis DSM 22698 = JCM 13996]